MRLVKSAFGHGFGKLGPRWFPRYRWLQALLAVTIAAVSSFMSYGTLRNDYWNYWLWPKLKSADPGLYIYPQLRYALFDILVLLWCLDGLFASGTTLWGLASHSGIGKLAYRTMSLYVALLVVLILGGSLMLYVRSRGY